MIILGIIFFSALLFWQTKLTRENIATCSDIIRDEHINSVVKCLRDRTRWTDLALYLGFSFEDTDDFVDHGKTEGERAKKMLRQARDEKDCTVKDLVAAAKEARIQGAVIRALLGEDR